MTDRIIPQEHPAAILRRERYSEPYQTADGAWFVRETGSDGITTSIRILNRDDQTYGEAVPYVAKCAICWLGYGHSAALHRQSINR